MNKLAEISRQSAVSNRRQFILMVEYSQLPT